MQDCSLNGIAFIQITPPFLKISFPVMNMSYPVYIGGVSLATGYSENHLTNPSTTT